MTVLSLPYPRIHREELLAVEAAPASPTYLLAGREGKELACGQRRNWRGREEGSEVRS
jgi:hypothetical protein